MTEHYRQSPATQALAMAELARAALPKWNVSAAEVTLLKLRENAVFRVDTPGGVSYVLRIHRHNYHSDAELHSELQWLMALANAGIEAPQNVVAASGRPFEIVGIEAVPEPRQVDLLAWMNGRPMGTFWSSSSDELATLTGNFRLLGELAARLHNQATSWRLPAGFTRHQWDAEGIVGETPFWGRFWELDALTPAHRHLLAAARARVHGDLLRLGKNAATYSMIHADLVPENVLVDGDAVRVIDFDDSGFGWHQFEIATALISHLGRPYFDGVRDALVEGYRRHRRLPDAALEQLPLFFLARSLTYLSWVHTRYETELAQQLTPSFVETSCSLAEAYLSS